MRTLNQRIVDSSTSLDAFVHCNAQLVASTEIWLPQQLYSQRCNSITCLLLSAVPICSINCLSFSWAKYAITPQELALRSCETSCQCPLGRAWGLHGASGQLQWAQQG